MYNPIHRTDAVQGEHPVISQSFHTHNVSASWEIQHSKDTGSSLSAKLHARAGWMSLTLREQGVKSSKRTSYTFSKQQVAELKRLLAYID